MEKVIVNNIPGTQNNSSIPKRSASADLLKCMAITAVLIIHSQDMIPVYSSMGKTEHQAIATAMAGLRFCVPVFIFLWAYFMEKSFLKNGSGNIFKKFYRLLIPFAFWSLVYFMLNSAFPISITSIITKYWTGYGWSGQYYFIILFQLILLYLGIRRFALKLIPFIPLVYILSLLFYITISYSGYFNNNLVNKLSYRPFFYWLPYVILGIAYAHKNIFSFSLPLGMGIASLIIGPLEIYLLKPQITHIYVIPGIFISTMLLLSTLEAKLSYSSLSTLSGKMINSLANYTLGIFCLNPLIITTLSPIFKSCKIALKFTGATIITPIISTLVVMICCILIIKLLKLVRLGFLVAN